MIVHVSDFVGQCEIIHYESHRFFPKMWLKKINIIEYFVYIFIQFRIEKPLYHSLYVR